MDAAADAAAAAAAAASLATDPEEGKGKGKGKGKGNEAALFDAALRAAVRDLGYRGFTLADLDADLAGAEQNFRDDLEGQLAASGEGSLRVMIVRTMLGAIARRRGDCASAESILATAHHHAPSQLPGKPDARDSMLWEARGFVHRAMCLYTAGLVAEGNRMRARAWGKYLSKVELAELTLIDGFFLYEKGDVTQARTTVGNAAIRGDERVRAALDTWLDAVDWDLR